MTTHLFSTKQAAHALEVVLTLMKDHRFFLFSGGRKQEEVSFWGLTPGVFTDALDIDYQLRAVYVEARGPAEKTILARERELGIAAYDLGEHEQLVQCNRHTGGLGIYQVFPLTTLTQYAPDSPDALENQCLAQLMGEETRDTIAPAEFRKLEEHAAELAGTIWPQLEEMDLRRPEDERCVVMMRSRISSSDLGQDLLRGVMPEDMQKFPKAMGYLFHALSMHDRMIYSGSAVFSTSRRSHVSVHHHRHSDPMIHYDFDRGYDYNVMFVTVL